MDVCDSIRRQALVASSLPSILYFLSCWQACETLLSPGGVDGRTVGVSQLSVCTPPPTPRWHLYGLFCLFGMSSWLIINATFLQMPNLAALPEGNPPTSQRPRGL